MLPEPCGTGNQNIAITQGTRQPPKIQKATSYWTAAGRFDGYWERNLYAWDLAAGIVILREAGGYVSDAEGGQRMLETGSVVAGNEAIHGKILKLIKTTGAQQGEPKAAAPAP